MRHQHTTFGGTKYMAAYFSLVHGLISSNLTAIDALSLEKENSSLKFEQLQMGQRELENSEQRNESAQDRRWVHKYRALFAAAKCPGIQSICFLPMQPEQAQLLYAQRGRNLSDMKGFISALDIESPHEKITEVFRLTNAVSLSETTWDLTPSVRSAVREILSHIVEDAETLGVALHFFNDKNKPSTFAWTK